MTSKRKPDASATPPGGLCACGEPLRSYLHECESCLERRLAQRQQASARAALDIPHAEQRRAAARKPRKHFTNDEERQAWRKEYTARWRAAHREGAREYSRSYYRHNAEREKAKQRARYAANPIVPPWDEAAARRWRIKRQARLRRRQEAAELALAAERARAVPLPRPVTPSAPIRLASLPAGQRGIP